MVSKLLPLIPEHKVYCEPFSGGAALFFAKDRVIPGNRDHYREVLNDTNHELVNFYEVVKTRRKEFLYRLKGYCYSEYWYGFFKDRKDTLENPVLRAVGFYIRIMMAFAAQQDGGFAFGKQSQNNPVKYRNKLADIDRKIDRLQDAHIFYRDALDIIQRFDTPDTFFYCDPPYPGTQQGAYSGYTQQDFEKLLDILKQCKGRFLLSCYHNDSVPSDWVRYEFKSLCSSSNTSKGGHRKETTEVVWTNFKCDKDFIPFQEKEKVSRQSNQLRLAI